jgi:hypoxanthine phosphoribosyltransferase
LTGSFIFLADLVRRLSRYDIEPRINFIKVSHYDGGTEADQAVHFLKRTIPDLAGESVLLVDDILDSGHSLGVVVDYVTQKEAVWLRLCTLLDKVKSTSGSAQSGLCRV